MPDSPDVTAWLTLDEVKAQLEKVTTADDVEVQGYLDAATDIIVRRCGPILTTSITGSFDGGQTSILLPARAQSVTTVVENTITLTAGQDYVADCPNGVLYRTDLNGRPRRWGNYNHPWPQRQAITVTYVAGWTATVTPDVRLATLLLIQHLWQTAKIGSAPGRNMVNTSSGNTASTYILPNRVMELLEPYVKLEFA